MREVKKSRSKENEKNGDFMVGDSEKRRGPRHDGVARENVGGNTDEDDDAMCNDIGANADKITAAQRRFLLVEKLHVQAPRLTRLLGFCEAEALRVVSLIQHHVGPTLFFPFSVELDEDSGLLLLLVLAIGFGTFDKAIAAQWREVPGADAALVIDAVGADEAFVIDLAYQLFFSIG
jgi:hypothetical protein